MCVCVRVCVCLCLLCVLQDTDGNKQVSREEFFANYDKATKEVRLSLCLFSLCRSVFSVSPSHFGVVFRTDCEHGINDGQAAEGRCRRSGSC